MIHITAMIHSLSCVDRDTVSIGRLTRVWQFASIIRRAVVGKECRIASCSIIDGARVGDRCIIGHGAFVGPGISIGNDVFIGPNVTLANDAWPRTEKGGWFTVSELISGERTVIRVEDGASIGAGAVVLPGLRVGAGAMVAAGAMVERGVPALVLYRRDGSLVPIDPSRTPNRRRLVTE